jgi:holo-[acyl-carrier protein] synthase
VRRIERALERRPRLAQRLFSADELAYARARRRPGRHLAARFAAKEAAIKALGLTSPVGMREIEIEAGEPPTVNLSGAAAAAAAAQRVHLQISLTHSQDFAAAVAIAE